MIGRGNSWRWTGGTAPASRFISSGLYLRDQAGVYSGQLGGPLHEVCTNHYTFKAAFASLEREGLVTCELLPVSGTKVKVARKPLCAPVLGSGPFLNILEMYTFLLLRKA